MRPSLEKNKFSAKHGPVSEAGPSIVSQRRGDLGSADKRPYKSEATLSDDDAPAFGLDSPDVSETFHCLSTSDLEAIPEEAAASPERTCRFDDEDAEYLSSDSELDWENAPFDYDVIFEACRGQVVPSEPGLPDGTPVFRAFAARLAQQIAEAITNQAQALQGHARGIYNGGVTRAEQAAQTAQLVAREIERAGLAMAHEAQRLGNDISKILHRRWPGIMRGMNGNEWRERVTEAVMQAVALMPMLDRQIMLGRDRQQ